MWERLSSRKFILSMSAMFSVTWLSYFEKISDGVYSTVMVATIGAYIAGNVIQKKDTNATKLPVQG